MLEAIFTIVILAVLTKVAMSKLVMPGTLTVQAQAQSIAEAVRRAQSLAMMQGKRMSVTVTSGTNGGVAIACVASAPCGTDTSTMAAQGVTVGSMGTIYFNSLGRPVNSGGTPLMVDASFTVGYSGGASFTVSIAALTGRVSVSP